MSVATGQGRLGGLAFATPGDWFAIRLPGQQVDADRLADVLLAAGGAQDLPQEAIRSLVGDLVRACATLNVICAYGTILDPPGGPLPATLIASVRAMGEFTLDEIAAQMAAGADAGSPDVSTIELPAGRAVRLERRQELAGAGGASRPLGLVVQYIVAAPGAATVVLLTFSTPAVALADQLRTLFHGIARTLRFEDPAIGPAP